MLQPKHQTMRIILFLLASVVANLTLFAQSNIIFTSPRSIKRANTIDTTRYIVQYLYTHQFGEKKNKAEQDIVLLEIGRNVAKSYSHNLYQCDSLADVWEKEGRQVRQTYQGYAQREVLYTSLQDKTITTIYRSFSDAPTLLFREDIPIISWTIEKDKKQLLGYDCIKATAHYRGRNYIAWFTPNIPSSLGPWKFSNLPGLILDIYDDKGEIRFTAEGINNHQRPISVWSWQHIQTTRSKARQMIERMFKSPTRFLRSMGIQLFTPNGPIGDNASCTYNPIELE